MSSVTALAFGFGLYLGVIFILQITSEIGPPTGWQDWVARVVVGLLAAGLGGSLLAIVGFFVSFVLAGLIPGFYYFE